MARWACRKFPEILLEISQCSDIHISGNFQGNKPTRGGPPAARRGISGNFQGNKPMFGDQQMSSLADVIRAALMLRYNDRMVG